MGFFCHSPHRTTIYEARMNQRILCLFLHDRIALLTQLFTLLLTRLTQRKLSAGMFDPNEAKNSQEIL